MTETRTRMTAEELSRLTANGKRHELVAGELIEMAPPGGEHGYVGGRIQLRIGAYVEQHGLGGSTFLAETGFLIRQAPDTVRAPDVAYVAQPRVAQARVAGYPELAPDLVIEVVSPNDTAADVEARVEDWLRAGTLLVWVVYPATRSAMVHQPDGRAQHLNADDELRGEPVLPGFICRLADIFA